MKVVVQRVKKAKVSVNKKIISQIGNGYLVFVGFCKNDSEKQVDWLAKKVANLRVMSDKQGKMNKSLLDIGGEILVVSQFTLYGDCSKGNRPSFIKAAEPKVAEKLYNIFLEKLKNFGIKVKSGMFRAMMDIELINDGPVTLTIENKD